MNRIVVILIVCVLASAMCSPVGAAVSALSGTKPRDWQQEDLSDRLMHGAHLFNESHVSSGPGSGSTTLLPLRTESDFARS